MMIYSFYKFLILFYLNAGLKIGGVKAKLPTNNLLHLFKTITNCSFSGRELPDLIKLMKR